MDSLPLLLGVCLIALRGVGAYPTGPPPSTCLGMMPKHSHLEKQTGAVPFRLALSSATYSPGQNVTVTVESVDGARTFKGFQVTVHRVGSSGNAEDFIGTFSPGDNSSQTVTCLGHPKKMLAHADGSNRTTVTGVWTAPDVNVGDVQFFLSVVEKYDTFWSKITAGLQAATAIDVVPPQHIVPGVSVTADAGAPDWSSCGSGKGCWLVPGVGQGSCSGGDCQAALSYRREGALFHMEMAVKGQGEYIAVSFSDDKVMGDDQTVLCTANPGYESVQVGYNPAQYYDRQFTMGVSNLTVGQADGYSYCRFSRQASLESLTPANVSRTFDITDPHFVFLAWGHVYLGSDSITKHSEAPAISEVKLDLTQTTSAGPSVSCSILITWLTVATTLTATLAHVH